MFDGEELTGIIDATPGRLIFNSFIPQDLGFVDRTLPEKQIKTRNRFSSKKEKNLELL